MTDCLDTSTHCRERKMEREREGEKDKEREEEKKVREGGRKSKAGRKKKKGDETEIKESRTKERNAATRGGLLTP